jgi:hypothetical protein
MKENILNPPSRNLFYLLSLCIVSLVFGCTDNKKQTSEKVSKQRETVHINTKSTGKYSSMPNDTVLAKTVQKFVFENDSIIQSIDIRFITEKKIQFAIRVVNKISKGTKQLSGIAIREVEGDPETDEDADGYAYSAIEYVHKAACELNIRVAMEKRDKVQINGATCDAQADAHYPFNSLGVLTLIKY